MNIPGIKINGWMPISDNNVTKTNAILRNNGYTQSTSQSHLLPFSCFLGLGNNDRPFIRPIHPQLDQLIDVLRNAINSLTLSAVVFMNVRRNLLSLNTC